MNFWEKITGNDLKQEFKTFESRVQKLPADYQAAWGEINGTLWLHSDFTGHNIMSILSGVLDLFEETSADGQSVQRLWVMISKASVQHWQVKQGQSLIVISGAINLTIPSPKN